MVLRRIVDLALEGPVAPSFTRIGHDVRRAVDGWTDPPSLDDRVILVTGGTSGLGRAAATTLVALGARVIITGRAAGRTTAAAAEIAAEADSATVSGIAADMGEPEDVDHLAEQALAAHDRLDVVIHNAGALSAERRTNSLGQEATVASQVYGPFRFTSLVLDRLEETAATHGSARVLTMSSGGMYAAPLSIRGLELSDEDYNGTRQYALAKRAQVTLNELWAEHHGDRGVVFHALHPGWADTPGVAESLPGFGRLLGPLLRTPEQGADTLVWLASDDTALESNGGFWHDRRRRSIHKTPLTKRSDTPDRRTRLWEAVAAAAEAPP